MRSTIRRAAWLTGLLAVLALSCSAPMNHDAGPNCTPGQSGACTCDGGARGAQVCSASGTFAPCACVTLDGATDGADGSDDIARADAPQTDLGIDTPANCDQDNDGHLSLSCAGGDDCDDNDPDRYPTNREVCNGTLTHSGAPAANHDEDCNPCTVFNPDVGGDGDLDHDGYPSVSCVNPWRTTSRPVCTDLTLIAIDPPVSPDPLGRVHGNDCDDSKSTINPGASEICDNVDNNCSASTDEGCDDDNDDYCDATMTL
ncbi:MAG: putative metal-binding motif-containing protein, partial [Deltaproteobacteria bacterium]